MATDVPSIPAGYALEAPQGIVLLRIERVNGSGEPDTFGGPNDEPFFFHRTPAELIWLHRESRQGFAFAAASDGTAADFYVAVPPGHYSYNFTVTPYYSERDFQLRFEVRPGAVVCVGTLRFQHDYFPMYARQARSVSLRDGCDEIADRFRASHPEIRAEVQTSLFAKYEWQGGTTGGWVPEAWGADGTP